MTLPISNPIRCRLIVKRPPPPDWRPPLKSIWHKKHWRRTFQPVRETLVPRDERRLPQLVPPWSHRTRRSRYRWYLKPPRAAAETLPMCCVEPALARNRL